MPKSDERFARQYRFGPPPEFPLASPRSGIVHHLSGPDRHAPTRTLHRRSGSAGGAPPPRGAAGEAAPAPQLSLRLPGFARPSTRTHIRLLGPCFKTGRMGKPRAVAWSASVAQGPRRGGARGIPSRTDGTSAGGSDRPGLGRRRGPQRSAPRAERRSSSSPFRIRPGRIAGPHPLPSRQFQALFDSLFKVLFILPSRYLFAIGLAPVFSLGRNLPPDWGCIPKQPDSPTAPRGAAGSEPNGALTLPGTPFQGT